MQTVMCNDVIITTTTTTCFIEENLSVGFNVFSSALMQYTGVFQWREKFIESKWRFYTIYAVCSID